MHCTEKPNFLLVMELRALGIQGPAPRFGAMMQGRYAFLEQSSTTSINRYQSSKSNTHAWIAFENQ